MQVKKNIFLLAINDKSCPLTAGEEIIAELKDISSGSKRRHIIVRRNVQLSSVNGSAINSLSVQTPVLSWSTSPSVSSLPQVTSSKLTSSKESPSMNPSIRGSTSQLLTPSSSVILAVSKTISTGSLSGQTNSVDVVSSALQHVENTQTKIVMSPSIASLSSMEGTTTSSVLPGIRDIATSSVRDMTSSLSGTMGTPELTTSVLTTDLSSAMKTFTTDLLARTSSMYPSSTISSSMATLRNESTVVLLTTPSVKSSSSSKSLLKTLTVMSSSQIIPPSSVSNITDLFQPKTSVPTVAPASSSIVTESGNGSVSSSTLLHNVMKTSSFTQSMPMSGTSSHPPKGVTSAVNLTISRTAALSSIKSYQMTSSTLLTSAAMSRSAEPRTSVTPLILPKATSSVPLVFTNTTTMKFLTPSPTSTSLPVPFSKFTVTFQGNCTTAKDNLNTFKSVLTSKIAKALNTAKENVVIGDVICGSVIVQFTVRNPTPNTTNNLKNYFSSSPNITVGGELFKAYGNSFKEVATVQSDSAMPMTPKTSEVSQISTSPSRAPTTPPTSSVSPTKKKDKKDNTEFILYLIIGCAGGLLLLICLIILIIACRRCGICCACCTPEQDFKVSQKTDLELDQFKGIPRANIKTMYGHRPISFDASQFYEDEGLGEVAISNQYVIGSSHPEFGSVEELSGSRKKLMNPLPMNGNHTRYAYENSALTSDTEGKTNL